MAGPAQIPVATDNDMTTAQRLEFTQLFRWKSKADGARMCQTQAPRQDDVDGGVQHFVCDGEKWFQAAPEGTEWVSLEQ